MALQAGEIFASFTVDTKAAELALDHIEKQAEEMLPRFASLGEAAVAALGQALSGAAGASIGSQFAQGLAEGIMSAQESVTAPEIKGFNPAGRFYIYGIDWSEEKISWWIKTSPSSEKTIIAESTDNVPVEPLRFEIRLYHSKLYPAQGNSASTQAPLYPYETEIDWAAYLPSVNL